MKATTFVSESALAGFLGWQPGEVEVLEAVHAHNDPDLWMVSFTFRNQDEPVVHSLYIYGNELEPYLDVEKWTVTKWLNAVKRLGVDHPSITLRGDGKWEGTSPPGGLNKHEMRQLADIMDKWVG